MTNVPYARWALSLAEIAVREFAEAEGEGPWRPLDDQTSMVRWIAAISCLHIVGEALKIRDCNEEKTVPVDVYRRWKIRVEIKGSRDELIKRIIVHDYRRLTVHRFQFPHGEQDVSMGTGYDTYQLDHYTKELGIVGRKAGLVLQEVLDWWATQLDRIDEMCSSPDAA